MHFSGPWTTSVHCNTTVKTIIICLCSGLAPPMFSLCHTTFCTPGMWSTFQMVPINQEHNKVCLQWLPVCCTLIWGIISEIFFPNNKQSFTLDCKTTYLVHRPVCSVLGTSPAVWDFYSTSVHITNVYLYSFAQCWRPLYLRVQRWNTRKILTAYHMSY